MEFGKYFKYKININVIGNLEEAKATPGYFDYLTLGKKTYAIIIDPVSKDKGLAKSVIEGCLPVFESILLNRQDLKKGITVSEESSFEVTSSED